ncbi:hypothetical protein [Streptomyces marincola]|uniref:hypothetical protein n=1 Tax=Streptomyces marincola TaxID=2878388 RepID=UPI001CF5DAAF|nr:hypothetical protein [Streptomyces marincola]UCM90279.1 hypothetical protein LC193_21380 [Streptomyces marincola]
METSASAPRPGGPNLIFRSLRGARSQGEFAAAVRRAAREIGERVCCDARYIGRVEAGEIRCPNYAYERVFLHMFPGRSLTELGFQPRQLVRGRVPRADADPSPPLPQDPRPRSSPHPRQPPYPSASSRLPRPPTPRARSASTDIPEEGDVLRRAFMTGGTAAVASLTALAASTPAAARAQGAGARAPGARPGAAEAAALRQQIRDIRLLDDRYGARRLYRPAGEALRAAHELLDVGARRQAVNDELHAGAGELAISVGWLAHDSGRLADARSHYAEALATARVAGDGALEAHAFCNTASLAADADRPREAVRAAEAAQQAARRQGTDHLRALLSLREARGWARLDDRGGAEAALARARAAHERGPAPEDPEWMTFYGDAEFACLEAECWASLGDHGRAVESGRRAVEAALLEPRFTRNLALYSAQLAGHLARDGEPEEAAAFGHRSLDLLADVRSSRITDTLASVAGRLTPARGDAGVATFLDRVARGGG